jgi:hypothetical protein
MAPAAGCGQLVDCGRKACALGPSAGYWFQRFSRQSAAARNGTVAVGWRCGRAGGLSEGGRACGSRQDTIPTRRRSARCQSAIDSIIRNEPGIQLLNLLANDHCAYGHSTKEIELGSWRQHPNRCNVVGTLGNHEFDAGIDEIRRLLNGGNAAYGPFLKNPYRGSVCLMCVPTCATSALAGCCCQRIRFSRLVVCQSG